MKLLIRISHQKARKVGFITTTQAGRSRLLSWGVASTQICVAPNGIDLEQFVDLKPARLKPNLPNTEKEIGFAGSLYPGRGIEEIIEAAQILKDSNFFVVGGQAADIERCERIAKRQGITNIHFLGFLPQQIMYQYLAAFDILIMPYTTDTPTYRDMSPMKMFEYMAAGKPIVATDFPVIREVLQHNVNAVLVSPDSGTALADGIQWCLKHPKEAQRLGKQARKDVENYTWKKRAERIKTWIESELSY